MSQHPVNLKYALPPAVEGIRSGWVTTMQSAAVVSGLLVVVQSQLLVFYTDDSNFANPGPNSATQNAIKILTYVALICSVSSTLSSLLLIDELVEIPTRSARTEGHTMPGRIYGTDWNILASYRVRTGTRLVVYHWLICLFTACLCTIASTATYAGTQEPLTTQIIVSLVAGFAALPLCWLAFPVR